jgi:hypothetical protein
MDAGTSKPFKVIPMVTVAAFKFDAIHKNNKEYTTTAANHARHFICWAWGVGAGRVIQTKLTFNPNNANLECFENERHQTCIIKPWTNIPGGLPPAPAGENANAAGLGILNATLAQQVDKQEMQINILTKQLDHTIEKDGLSKNRFKNLHKSTIKMHLFASGMDNETVQSTSQSPANALSTAKQSPSPNKNSTFSLDTAE